MKHILPPRRHWRTLRLLCLLASLGVPAIAHATEQHGQVTFNGLPVPGAVITATQGAKKLTAISDQQGNYAFPDLADGPWKITVEMSFFSTQTQQITMAVPSPGMQVPGIRWELKMLPLDQDMAKTKVVVDEPKPTVAATAPSSAKSETASKSAAPAPKPPDEAAQQSNDGFLVNGSVNNAATSQFTLAPGFGNTRKGTSSLYTGGLSAVIDNSALDARPYSLSGLALPRSPYNLFTGVATFGGPLRIPHLLPRGPNFFVAYEWTRNNSDYALSGLVPTLAQRTPTPTNPIDPIAQALLVLYPLPNLAGNANYNYQTSILAGSNQDAMQTQLNKSIGNRDQLYGDFGFQSRRSDNASLFHFHDRTDTLGLRLNANWQHRFKSELFGTLGYHFSRLRTMVSPYFENHTDIEGNAGIEGTDAVPVNWGPPTLVFSSGIATLYDAQSAFNRNRTEGISPSLEYYRGRHNISLGVDFRRQEFNFFTQQDPRGTFTFTGAATGVSDFADFLNGTPDTSSIAYGNADKYLRQSVYDAYGTDDWRLRPDLTLNVGVRWEYGAPITELKNRLVNLDVAPNFSAVQPVLASDPIGPLTGQHYPSSLVRPDRSTVEPRLGVSWRPIPGSSLVVRGGYGIYADTSVYQATALQLAQESPLSNTLSANNSPGCPLTLATGLIRQPCTATTPNSFAIDPNFRVGYAQTWQVSLQRDLPAALQVTATYLGVRGSHGVQEFLPNTYPLGGTDPCPLCPSGFVYRTSNGESTREAGSLQIRRRLRSGFTASLLYTFSKSLDDDFALGGQGPLAAGAVSQSTSSGSIAQNWLDLGAERGLSTFDQRHLLTTNLQYSTGTGIGGGTLLSGWRGRIYKEWTVTAQVNAGSGLPETPVYLDVTNGSGITGSLRPDRTGASVYNAPAGRFLNVAAYTAPLPGDWGNAGRDSIIGPGTFTFNGSLSRTFRIEKKYNLDIRVDATNLLNHAVYSSYNTTINPSLVSPLFGLPTAVNPMRSLQTTARLRF
jgi:hypothetical protein